jgi:ribosomal RNA-processing protein 1
MFHSAPDSSNSAKLYSQRSATPLTTLVEPFINLAARTPNKITYERMQTALITPLLDALTARSAARSNSDESGSLRKRKRSSEAYSNLIDSVSSSWSSGKDAPESVDIREIVKSIVKAIFEAAGKEEAKDANRRKMYAFWKSKNEEFEGAPEDDVVYGVVR